MAHKVFVSYHHANDQNHTDHLRSYYGKNNTLIDRSLQEEYPVMNNDILLGLIRKNHLRDSTVTIVLIGSITSLILT